MFWRSEVRVLVSKVVLSSSFLFSFFFFLFSFFFFLFSFFFFLFSLFSFLFSLFSFLFSPTFLQNQLIPLLSFSTKIPYSHSLSPFPSPSFSFSPSPLPKGDELIRELTFRQFNIIGAEIRALLDSSSTSPPQLPLAPCSERDDLSDDDDECPVCFDAHAGWWGRGEG